MPYVRFTKHELGVTAEGRNGFDEYKIEENGVAKVSRELADRLLSQYPHLIVEASKEEYEMKPKTAEKKFPSGGLVEDMPSHGTGAHPSKGDK